LDRRGRPIASVDHTRARLAEGRLIIPYLEF
jgi:hypothetical protein